MNTTKYYVKQLADINLEIDAEDGELELKELIAERDDILITTGVSLLAGGIPESIEELKEEVAGLNRSIEASNNLSEQQGFIKGRDALYVKIGYELAKSLFAPELYMEPRLSESGNIPMDDARELTTEIMDLWQELKIAEQKTTRERAYHSVFAQG